MERSASAGFLLVSLLALAGGCGQGREANYEEAGPSSTQGAAVFLQDTVEARLALERYWEALAQGDYPRAACLYAGDWREVAHWVDPAIADTLSSAGFLANTCGGLLVCDLRVSHVARIESPAPEFFRLTVGLADSGGAPFQYGPCCGEDGEPHSEFEFGVRKVGGRFLVESLPIYIP